MLPDLIKYTKKDLIHFYIKSIINAATKKIIPNVNVSLLINSSLPRSFLLLNKSKLPPLIIWLALSAFPLCSKTIIINKMAIIKKNISIIFSPSLSIRYHKLSVKKVLIQSVGIIILAQLVLLGIMAITRMPVGKTTIPVVIIVYMISTYICTEKFEKELDKVKIETKSE